MKMRMRMKNLILCLSSTLLALVMQTYLCQKASAALIYNQAKTENMKEIAVYLKNSLK